MPNKDKSIAAAQNRKGQAAWRDRLKTYQEWGRTPSRNGKSTTSFTTSNKRTAGLGFS